MSEKFDDAYQKLTELLKNFTTVHQEPEAKKYIKIMEEEICKCTSDTEKINMKKKYTTSIVKLKEILEEIKFMLNKSKCDITCNESSITNFINTPENNVLMMLNKNNNKGLFAHLEEEKDINNLNVSNQIKLKKKKISPIIIIVIIIVIILIVVIGTIFIISKKKK